MPRTPSVWQKRLLLSATALVLSLALAEGLFSLATDRSLLRLARGSEASPTGVAPRNEAERRVASAGNAGPYVVHRDALVAYVLRPEAEVEVHGERVHTDALGLRRRTGPEPDAASRPLRVAVLGDSIAFGFGLADGEVIAEHLERRLAALRPAGEPPVLCRTVAVPSWNVRNEVAFLRDHWDQLQPDIVVHVPCENDLDDTKGVLESGFLTNAQDVAQADPWLSSVGTAALVLQRQLLTGRDEAQLAALRAMAGPPALISGLGPESTRRYSDNVRLLSDLDGWLDARGGHLLLAAMDLNGYAVRLALRLRKLPHPVPVLSLFSSLTPEMILPDDPHPNARAAQAMGERIADDLVERGWVAGRPDAPAATGPFAALRGAPPEDEALEARAREALDRDRRALRGVVDFENFEGINQVYGTLNPDGSAGARLVLLLAPAGLKLELELGPLPQRPDLYPLDVEVLADDQPLGRLTVPAEGPVRTSFELPAAAPRKLARELRLVPARWVTMSIHDVPQIASFVPRRFALGD
jgi:lysophospholipase L1-like esterase